MSDTLLAVRYVAPQMLGHRQTAGDEVVVPLADYMRAKRQLAEANAELSETKDYCNGIWELIKMYIPMCPAKSIVMIDKAMADGKALREKYKSEVEKDRDTLQAKVKELEAQVAKLKTLGRELLYGAIDAPYNPNKYAEAFKCTK